MMSRDPSPRELAAEALALLRARHEDPKEHFRRLVELGWINWRGEVTRLLGGDAEPEVPLPAANGEAAVQPPT